MSAARGCPVASPGRLPDGGCRLLYAVFEWDSGEVLLGDLLRAAEDCVDSGSADPVGQRADHRGDCHAARDLTRPATTEQARAVLTGEDAAPCPLCRPDRPLRTVAYPRPEVASA
ncbi:DUF6233 domain-containing protein [Streptomyces sp. NBC_01198]|uniref:DUF6233 domain-containing protein n=1 Tax=Streptomyces sp. NBC_01198 TaxID=2903769 RepID=UPI003FA38DFE